jgi:hypothetical protein
MAWRHDPAARLPVGDRPWLQAPNRDYLSELETIMRAAHDLDDYDH